MIIGPMIRKMREKNAEKNRPLASDEERDVEAPGLKVGTGVWKWPPIWPYSADLMQRPQEEKGLDNPMGSAMMGMGGEMSNTEELAKKAAENKFNPEEFWTSKNGSTTTDMDPDAVNQFKNHLGFYLRDGMSMLELGAGDNSYLPDGLKLSRHIGVGLQPELMEKNPALTESYKVNLDNVVRDMGVDSDELRNIGENTMDVVLMTNTVEFLTSPREVFKSAWRILKPGGIMIVAFPEKDNNTEKFGDAQTKMWRQYNDDQHIWMTGSFFQFSAGDGWEKLNGFDISPEDASKDDGNFFSNMVKQKKTDNMYVVQARKGAVDDAIDPKNPEKSIKSLMWMLPTMEERDKQLVTPSIAKAFAHFDKDQDRQIKIKGNVEYLPKIYECLIKMDQFAFPFNLQARLATDLVTDPDFNANEKQITALKMGLGLKKPSKEFWEIVGTQTANMNPDDKVNLLSYIVPRFGSSNPEQEDALQSFVTGISPTIAVLGSKVDGITASDKQLLATELLASELLIPGRSSRENFASWLNELTTEELKEYLSNRQRLNEDSKAALQAMRDEREAKIKEEEEKKKKFKEQVDKAREERTMVFNEKTGKMEPVKK